jgi:nanoRNase/pAp phosphatase (c-di-AMP/oligoRNAs hydrolase)
MWLIFKKMESDWTSCSFRARFPYVINTAISESLEGLKGQGGGHPQSGGCAVNLKDFETFKTRFEDKINEQLKNK